MILITKYEDWTKCIHPRDVASFETKVKEAIENGPLQ